MKLEKSELNELNLDFETPEPGVSILQVGEGIRIFYNENSGKTSLIIPLVIVKVIEGPENNYGLKLTYFVPIETDWGEKQIVHILTITDLIDEFSAKFNGEVDINDDRFINTLKLKLVGKLIQAEHVKRFDKNKRERASIAKIIKFNSSKDNPSPIENSDSRPADAKNEDW